MKSWTRAILNTKKQTQTCMEIKKTTTKTITAAKTKQNKNQNEKTKQKHKKLEYVDLKVKAERSKIQGHSWLYNELRLPWETGDNTTSPVPK